MAFDVATGTLVQFGTFTDVEVTSLNMEITTSQLDSTHLSPTEPTGTQVGGGLIITSRHDFIVLTLDVHFDPDKGSPTTQGVQNLSITFPDGEDWVFAGAACEQYTVNLAPHEKMTATAVFKAHGVTALSGAAATGPSGTVDVGAGCTLSWGSLSLDVETMTIDVRRAVHDSTHLSTTTPTGEQIGGPTVLPGKLDFVQVTTAAQWNPEAAEGFPNNIGEDTLTLTYPTPAGGMTGAIWTWSAGAPAGALAVDQCSIQLTPEEKMIANLVWKMDGIFTVTAST